MHEGLRDRQVPPVGDARAAAGEFHDPTGASDSADRAGGMARLVAITDWRSTPLGHPDTWPHSLRTVVRILLTSRYAMWMGWGPDLTFLYNDAYATMTLGSKHPWALGRPSRDVWAEIWPQIGPRIEHVLSTGEATWDERLLLFLERSGYPEETYHTFSYSPLPDDHGVVRGHLCVVTEDTERVIDERRLGVLKELGIQLAAARREDDVCVAVNRTLALDARDLPFTAMYLWDGQLARLAAATGIPADGVPETPASRQAVAAMWGVADVPTEPQVLAAPAFATWAADPWEARASRVILVPIHDRGQDGTSGVFVAGANPFRRVDEKYLSFVNLFVGQVAAALANARAYEQERRQAEALAALDLAKTQFFSNVSHEFRTPLTLMLGPTEDALQSPAQSLSGDDLRTVYRNEIRLLKLVNTLLDFSRLEAGRMRPVPEAVDLAALTRDVAETFRAQIERGGLRFDVHSPAVGEPVHVDRQMWEKVVLNLLSNAYKFTFDGEIAVALSAAADHVQLTVSDSGVGIPPEHLPRVFERFHRVDGAVGRTHEGSGIGLALVHDLVSLHGGTIGVTSEVSRGTTFTVTLPRSRDRVPASEDAGPLHISSTPALAGAGAFIAEAERWLPTSPPPAAGSVSDNPIGLDGSANPRSSTHILIVDDNADMREYLARQLGTRWSVELVADGVAALESIARRTPALILSDVMMPRLDGFGLLRELRANPATRDIPIIMLSARAGDEARIEGLEAGADDYLVKPFSARELVARVRTRLDLQRMGKRLDRQRAAVAQLFQHMPLPVAVLRGPRLVYEMANAAYLAVVGNRDIVGKPLHAALPEFMGQGFEALMEQVIRTGEPVVGHEARLMLERAGEIVETFWTFVYAPLTGDGDADVAVVAICNEVTDQVRARQRVEALAAEAQAASRAKDEFLAMLGHELRNPLAPILTALQLMQLKDSRSVEKERTIIERQTRHLVRLVDDLLDVSRIARGKIELKRERVEVALIVVKAIELASPLLEARGQRLTIDVASTGLMVDADASRLAQALANLLTNAAKYTEPSGQIGLVAGREGADIAIRVRDNGIGIESTMLPRVFDLFVQERQALDRSQGGLGLGLAIVRNIMTLHGGSATAASDGPGRGSEFVLRLPAAPVTRATAVAEDRAVPRQRAERRGVPVLVVDDNPDAAALLAEALSHRGHEVRLAVDGPDAIAVLTTFVPAVAVLDIGLPGMDGYELAARLRDQPRLAAIQLVAVTGYGQASDRARADASGFAAHLVKPVDIDRLDAVVRRLAAEKAARRAD